ncbi:MAG: type II toxin-antitoxin system VapC family toxin [Desulfuromonadaceae bacterium]
MNVVIDASAAVGVVLALPGTEIFTPLLEEAALVTAPDLYVAEISNALWKYRKADLLTMERCELLLEQALSLPDRLEESTALYQESFALACRHLHPVYDALYLILARRTNATLLTLDRRLAALAGLLEIKVIIPLKQ